MFGCFNALLQHPRRNRKLASMRLAWLLMAGCAALSAVRHAFEWIAVAAGWTQTRLTTLVSLRQIPIVLARCC
ncbi:MAG: hypothetical protein JSU00_08515 [Acidobacteria bacterium]|nr:hypothetical protein [Acidobacteriota bacterium]